MQLLANENTTLRESLLSFSSSLSQAGMKLGRCSAFFGTARRVHGWNFNEFHPHICSTRCCTLLRHILCHPYTDIYWFMDNLVLMVPRPARW